MKLVKLVKLVNEDFSLVNENIDGNTVAPIGNAPQIWAFAAPSAPAEYGCVFNGWHRISSL